MHKLVVVMSLQACKGSVPMLMKLFSEILAGRIWSITPYRTQKAEHITRLQRHAGAPKHWTSF